MISDLSEKTPNQQQRIVDILEAMIRCAEANIHIPEEWLEELTIINERIDNEDV